MEISGKTNKRYFDYMTAFRALTQNKRNRSLLLLALTLFTISFLAILVIRPTLITVAKLNREIKDKKELKEKLQAKIDAIVLAREQYNKISADLPLLEEALPEKTQFPQFAFYLEQTALSDEVSLDGLSFEKIGSNPADITKDPVTSVNTLNFSTGVSGDYLKLKKFLEDLEQSRRIIDLKSTGISRPEKKEGVNQQNLSLSVSGSIFFNK